MAGHKEQLLRALSDDGWEQSEVCVDTEWWAAEHWTIRSVREAYGLELVLTFLVDPQFDGPGPKASHVWAIIATSELPTERPLQKGIAELPLQRGRFEDNRRHFVACIRDWRREQ